MKELDRSVRQLTICFAIFAVIAAVLIGLGQESWNLPLLVTVASLLAFIYTDTLGWFSLHRFLVYGLMIVGAMIAIRDFIGNESTNKLLAVGNLLVYVQLPLMFQKKSKRVFEQMGVFLLLELVVAALVNDNVLYGVIMLPLLIVGCAALISLAQYSSLMRHSESVAESTSYWASLLHWLGKEQLVTRRSSGVKLTAAPDQKAASIGRASGAIRWRAGILPMAISTFLFSVAFFYIVPRLHSDAFERSSLGWGEDNVGFNDQISLQFIGELLKSDKPALRLSMINEKTGANYRPSQPPYIRMSVVHRYIDGPGQGYWIPGERGVSFANSSNAREIPSTSELDSELLSSSDRVLVTVIEKSPFGDVVASLPPFAQLEKSNFKTVRRDWRIIDPREQSEDQRGSKRRYSFMSLAFSSGADSPILPDFSDCLEDKQPSTLPLYRGELTRFPSSMDEALPELERILALSREPLPSKLSRALYLEDYLANSGEFTYSLSLTGPKERNLDPIADFLINKKRGHCQYFASSLALLLRSCSIPTRLAIGFRPNEYNDIGGYFPVLQQHAHTWVEAYFTLDEIAKSEQVVRNNVVIPPWATKGVWIRFDPTPSGEGSNAGGTFRISKTQTLDAMQDLWTEMVMNMDKSKQGSIFSLFGESSGSSYSNVWLQIQSALYRMQSSRFIGGLLSPDRWFSWRVAVAIFGLGGLLTVLFRWVPGLFPNLLPTAKRRKNALRRDASRVEFYERVAKLLRKLGLRRQDSQTQREFLNIAASELSSYGVSLDAGDLSEAFYEQRFGEAKPLDSAQKDRIQFAISQIESALKAGVRRKKHRA